MWGAVIGDYVGSHYEHIDDKGYNLPLINKTSEITDDTILLVATAEALLDDLSFDDCYRKWATKYPNAGYGPGFTSWLNSDSHSASGFSFGNGASTRATAIGFAVNSEKDALSISKDAAMSSHGHPEGIKGAQAVALAIYMLRHGSSENDVIQRMHREFDYLLFFDLDDLHQNYSFDSSAENTVPQAIFIGLNSTDHEDCLRKCLHIGGDTDTIMSIAGAIFESRGVRGINLNLKQHCERYLEHNYPDVKNILERFCTKFNLNNFEKSPVDVNVHAPDYSY